MKIGFIGTGNMGSAIINGLVVSKFVSEKEINIFDLNDEKAKKIYEKYSINILQNETEIVENSDIIILAVKPDVYSGVLGKIKDKMKKDKIILTIAAGVSISDVENIIGKDKKIVRTMPNTPAQVMEGMTAIAFNKNINSEEKEMIFRLLNSFGESIEIEEKLMHVFTAISGSLPAYVYMFAEALSDGGVLEGMPREKTYKIIAQAIKGSAEMMLKIGKHPGILKDEVTSPGGTTIEALKVLENGNFRGTLINAVSKCTEKSKKMGNNK